MVKTMIKSRVQVTRMSTVQFNRQNIPRGSSTHLDRNESRPVGPNALCMNRKGESMVN